MRRSTLSAPEMKQRTCDVSRNRLLRSLRITFGAILTSGSGFIGAGRRARRVSRRFTIERRKHCKLEIEKCKLQIRFEATSVAYAEPKLWFEAYATVPRKV